MQYFRARMPGLFLKIIKNGLLPIALGSGLFFIGMHPYHDWGDDFAQYLRQAENLSNGLPLAHNTYILNEDFVRIGPRAYPPVLPAILALAQPFFDDEIIAGKAVMTFFLLLFGWISFLFLQRQRVPYPVSLLLMVILYYHPWMLDAKSQILSDIPFAFFLVLALYLFNLSGTVKWSLTAGLAAAIAIGTRSVGWVLPVAAVILIAIEYFRTKKIPSHLLTFAGSSVICALLINWISGYYGSGGGYSRALGVLNDFTYIPDNLHSTIHHLQNIVSPDHSRWASVVLVLKAFFLVAFTLGLVKINLKNPGLPEFFLILYGLLIIIFPFQAGFRFLLPVFPLILVVAYRGFSNSSRERWWIVLGLVFALIYLPGSIKHYSNQKKIEGPQSSGSQEVFRFIQENIPEGEVIIFSKPRALAYYTKRATAGTLYEIGTPEFERQITALGAGYLLQYSGINYDALNRFVKTKKDRLLPVFSNSKFKLYQLTEPNLAY